MLIGIDAGHGINTPGKRCSRTFDKNETREWTLNSRVANYIQNYLKEYGVSTIRLDDTTGKTDISLANRCRTANNKKCDLVVSIHHNAGGGNGLETYVWNGKSLPNKTVQIATAIHNACINATGQKNRGLKRANFAMVRDTYMDAVLIEGGFMDNAEDTPRILSNNFAQKYARGVVNGIVKYYGLKGGNTAPIPQKPVNNTPSIDELARRVINGEYGTGEARKRALGSKYAEVQARVNQILKGGNSAPRVSYYARYTGNSSSIVEALNKIGINSSFNNRKTIAGKNGISNYKGTANQNITLLNLLKQGRLKK